jgi:outer membrane receptor protein involved in Fe transport
MFKRFTVYFFLIFYVFSSVSFAGIEGTVNGTVLDADGIAIPNVKVELSPEAEGSQTPAKLSPGIVVNSSTTGDFTFFPVNMGDYTVKVTAPGFAPNVSSVHVSSGGSSQVTVNLATKAGGKPEKEMVLEVKAKRRLTQSSAPVSSVEISKEAIAELPQGDQVKLPKLIANTTPGVVQGAFGQLFIRGNHASIQYQIDGVQMPDSLSNTFGEAFSPRNIDHMEVITGGIPAEYGERLAAVVNIATKGGPIDPGGAVELNYGSYNRTSPQLTYGGSNESGSFHYFLSANYFRTDRGLDTPQPVSESNQLQGDHNPVHDLANGNNEFLKLDWLANNENKFTFTFFNSYNFFQIPNYPGSFQPTDPFFVNTDTWGNTGFNWLPATTDDNQAEYNDYFQAVWKHTISPSSFFQLAAFWKFGYINVKNDQANDLSQLNPNVANASSFAEARNVNNLGVKADYSTRPDDRNLIKAGVQLQGSQATGSITVITPTSSSINSDPNTGYSESAYVQDDYTIVKPLTLSAGLRFSATQFSFSGLNTSDYYFQPRVGLTWLITDTTKFHVFYGKLYMPAPVENLRVTFNNLNAGNALAPYDIKAEKDDFYEAGIAQEFLGNQVIAVNVYYKNATNMLDDAQLLNTSIAQPFNFATGYATGLEVSVRGKFLDDWSEYVNYSYELAKGQGISGGLFAFQPGEGPSADSQFLDHLQLHTVNSGVTYSRNYFWGTIQALYGSGLRTGPGNNVSLPGHFTMDATAGYEFRGKSWWTKWKTAFDVLNIFDNAYPITIANGFNGSHYAAGREFLFHLTKEL